MKVRKFISRTLLGLIILLIGQSFQSAFAASTTSPDLQSLRNKVGEDLEYALDKNTKMLRLLKGGDEGLPLKPSPVRLLLESLRIAKPDPTVTAKQVMKEYGTYFGLKEPLKESAVGKKTTDKFGNNHIRFNQTYQSIPVFGGQLIVHVRKDGAVKAINGRAVPNISLDPETRITREEAIDKARKIWKEQFGLDEAKVIKAELYILNKSLIVKSLEDKNYLTWRVELYHKHPTRHEFYFINAYTGDLVYQLTAVKNAIGREIYDCSLYPFFLGCGLDYTWLGYTYGRSEGQPARGANPWWLNTDVDDLYDITNTIHNYCNDTFSLDGGNGLGGLGDGSHNVVTVTEGWVYIDDAGESCPNAYFDGWSINFCYGFVVTDVVGHEYGHGVLDFAVPDIPYTSEPGAVHEAYADITGEAVEYYRDGSNDWLNGGGITLVPSTPRSLISPGDYDDGYGNNPATYFSDDFYCGSGDLYGVHHNSTVLSHAAYLMAMGGTESSCTVRALGRAKEEQIFYQMITNYITTAVDFNQVYDGLLLACDDLYEDAYCTEVKRAAQAVEIDQSPGPCDSGTEATPDCAADQFPDVSSGHTFYDYIQDLAYGGAVSGYSDGYFRPENNVTRGQMAKFIVNGFGFTTDTSCAEFPDVAAGSTFYDYIMTLKCNGVISGYSDGTFRPDVNVTRGQAMKFVINGAREKTGNPNFLPISDPPPTFPDVPVGHTFYDYIMAAYSNNIVSGYGDGTFKPENATTRGAMSKMVDNTRVEIYWPD